MKQQTRFDVYGVGNALVDVEVEVDDETLANFGIDRGVMTLIDAERHHQLLHFIQGTRHHRACGGSAANTIIAVNQLGGKSFYSCRVGSDEAGKFFLSDLASHGVVTKTTASVIEGVTGKCLVMVTPDAERSMNTFLGVTGELDAETLDAQAIAQSRFVYIEGYLVSAPSALEAACVARDIARRCGAAVAVSLSDPSMVEFFRSGIDRLLNGGVDLLFCNRDEAMAYTRTDSVEQALVSLKQLSQQVVITLGKAGAVVWNGTEVIEINPCQAVAVDTNGAGDMFAGAFLYGLSHGYNHRDSGALASYASSLVVQKFGPRLDQTLNTKLQLFVEELAS